MPQALCRAGLERRRRVPRRRRVGEKLRPPQLEGHARARRTGRYRCGRGPQDRPPRPQHRGPRRHPRGTEKGRGRSRVGHREHRGVRLGKAGRGHPRAHGRVLLRQSGRGSEKGHEPEGQAGGVAGKGADRVPKREGSRCGKAGRGQDRARPRARNARARGVSHVCDRRLLTRRAAGRAPSEGPHVTDRAQARRAAAGFRARDHAAEPLLHRRRGMGRRAVSGQAQATGVPQCLRACPGSSRRAQQGGCARPSPRSLLERRVALRTVRQPAVVDPRKRHLPLLSIASARRTRCATRPNARSPT
jgi:hypothetical protein